MTEQELDWVLDPKEGVVVRCAFPPNPANINDCIRDRRTRFDAVKATRSTQYKYFGAESDDPRLREPDFERRKRQVVSELGYDPAKVRGRSEPKWCFDPLKPPADAPWRDPEQLRESARRIARRTGRLMEEEAA